MHHARLATSPRLRRCLKVLEAARAPLSTRTIMRRARVCAVNACIAELRANGCEIECRPATHGGRRVYTYRLIRAPKNWEV